jgi:epoxyqueuosine reductase
VLGNQRDPVALPALIKGLSDEEAVVRGAAAWALGRVGGDRAVEALRARLADEADQQVRDEIASALASADSAP